MAEKIRVTRYMNLTSVDLLHMHATIEQAAKQASKLQYTVPVCVAVPITFDVSTEDYDKLIELENRAHSSGKY